jgi:uncharacterized protein (DUF3820 family)
MSSQIDKLNLDGLEENVPCPAWNIIQFGKYKLKEIEEISKMDPAYCVWCLNQPFLEKYDELKKYLELKFKKDDIYMSFGKYKGKSLDWIKENDYKYIFYLKKNDYVKDKMPKLFMVL